jgi:hypothetical protein
VDLTHEVKPVAKRIDRVRKVNEPAGRLVDLIGNPARLVEERNRVEAVEIGSPFVFPTDACSVVADDVRQVPRLERLQ